MDLAATFCPNLHCPARGQIGQGNLGIHSRKERRFICKPCRKTFTTTPGPAFYRVRTPTETVSLVLTLMAHGCPLQAIVVAFGFDERTVAAWFARAGRQAQAVQEHVGEQPRDLGQGQADELRVKQQGRISWMALAMRVGPRLWLAGEVSAQRDVGLLRRLLGRIRRCAARRPLLSCTDGFRAYPRALRETFRAPQPTGKRGRPRWQGWKTLHSAQVVKHYVQRRVVRVERRIVAGPAAQVEKLRHRSQGGPGVLNTADIERLNAPCRERLVALTRRGRALARCTATLHAGMYLIGAVYTFGTYHTSLSRAAAGVHALQPPAMAAALTDHRWTVDELLSFRVPPPRWTPPKQRGRPSRALQRLVERWCA
jgi:transposase-like protein/IS1 family transposase